MNALTMTPVWFQRSRLLLMAWALATFLLSLLPGDVGGQPRLVNAVLFLCLGPACALVILLRRSMPLSVACVVAIGSSFAILVLSSQLLLLLGVWESSSVTAIVGMVTVVLAVVSGHRDPAHR